MINARSETLAEKPIFANSFKKKRCLIIADGFYEWKVEGKQKVPYFIYLKDTQPFAMAGLYDLWTNPKGETIATCTIVTTEANDFMKELHHRMPVIIPPESYDLWLNPAESDLQKLGRLFKPYDKGPMAAHKVGLQVNSPTHNAADCVDPVK